MVLLTNAAQSILSAAFLQTYRSLLIPGIGPFRMVTNYMSQHEHEIHPRIERNSCVLP